MTGTACGRPGCTGAIEDGYCNVCGLAPAQATAPRATSGASRPTGSTALVGGRSTTVSRRGSLGAGLLEIPPVQASDPALAVLVNPEVPEARRFCSKCEQPVGRASGSAPGRIEGYCKHDGTRFSFRPRLQAGDLVAGQYEVLGCLAHGGLGWIYLAKDRNVSDRWVVLKGLLNSGDASAQAVAVAERRFLAQVEHPAIVRIYNFVEHPDSETGDPTGYIVMEYVGGKSLRQIVRERRAAGGSVPVEHALAYAIEVLPALGYLHRLGLVYCDFKPDNVIQVEEQLKLIDLGGVMRMDDEDSPIYGTVGYKAPEIETTGPSPASDLYTVGRALAIMTFEFAGYTSTYEYRLPDPARVPVLAEHGAFYRLLQRATNTDPRRRFSSAADMADQLTGVLRQVLSASDGVPRPAFSSRFTPELMAIGARSIAGAVHLPSGAEIASGLPVPLVDTTDQAAGYLATLGALEPTQQLESLQTMTSAGSVTLGSMGDGIEVYLALARAQLALGDAAGAEQVLTDLAGRGLDDWRVTWFRGLAHLHFGRLKEAWAAFDDVDSALAGELAPKLALALVAEARGDGVAAARHFAAVWQTDRSYVSAAFGLARVRFATGDSHGAVEVLSLIPDSSVHFQAAQVAAIRAVLAPAGPAGLTARAPYDAAARITRLRLDGPTQHTLTTEVLSAALAMVRAGTAAGNGQLMGHDPTETGLRLGLESSYRALARLAATQDDRYALVDLANGIRPRTLA
jgi:serine/threonine-protein kinase PknG